MRGLALLLLAGTAAARPQDRLQARMEDLEEERKAHPSIITNCIAENSNEGIEKVRECLKCFENSGDPLSEEGLPKAKACTEDFLPRVSTECAEPIGALEPENEEMGSNALRCFADVTQVMAAEKCLAQSASDDMVDTLTDGVICLKDMHKNVTFQIHKLFEKEIKKDFEKFKKLMEKKKPKKTKMPKEDPMREQMMSLISKRHCEIASNTEEEEESCMECFESTQPTESDQPSKSEYVKSLATCSAEHLSPQYDECTTMMEEMAVDPEKNSKTMGKGIFLCYMRVVTKNLVEQCSNGMTETTPENLLNVMQCGSYTVFEWMQKNVRFPKIENFSQEDYSLEEDEENFYNDIQ